jgi:hypothetical protein
MDRRNSIRRCCSLCVSVQRHLGNTGLIRKNLDLLHCRTGAFGRDAKGLEHSFLCLPGELQMTPGKTAEHDICNLSIGEIE